jgi:hypothetical protein
VWLLRTDGKFSWKRAALVVVLSIAAAAASFYLVEQRVQARRAAMWLSPRRLIWVLPLVLALGIGTASAAVQAPVPPPGSISQRVLVVGDSVPRRLFSAFHEAAVTHGWEADDGAKGACPALGVTVTDARGALLDGHTNCGKVIPPGQAADVKEFKPTIVLWWSRYELADRLSDSGTHLAAGSKAFWVAQRASLKQTVNRLATGGATVVIVKTDRIGKGVGTRCSSASCAPFVKRLVDEDALRVTWNKMLDEQAHLDPRIRTVSMDDVYCHDSAAPCNDKLHDGTFARPDGSHFSLEYMPVAAGALADRIASAVAK